MSEYRAKATLGTIYPYEVMPPVGNNSVGACLRRADAERIARALALLDRLPAGVVDAVLQLPVALQEPQP